MKHPKSFRKLNKNFRSEELQAVRLLQLLPKAFLLSPDSEVNGCTRLLFKPNPAFEPSTYEERDPAMAGTVSIKEPEDRLCHLEARITQPVEFGFGLLGRLNSGGHFDLTRVQVDAASWKTEHISVHVDGRVLLLKNFLREQESSRSDIHLVPGHVTLTEAAHLSRP